MFYLLKIIFYKLLNMLLNYFMFFDYKITIQIYFLINYVISDLDFLIRT